MQTCETVLDKPLPALNLVKRQARNVQKVAGTNNSPNRVIGGMEGAYEVKGGTAQAIPILNMLRYRSEEGAGLRVVAVLGQHFWY